MHQISIIPAGRAGGYTLSLPKEDRSYQSKNEMENEIVSLLGGRVAEKLIIGDISTLSTTAWHNLSVIVMAVIARRFLDRRPPVTRDELAREYYLPVKIVDVIVTRLCKVGLVNIVDLDNDTTGLAPAVSMEDFTLAEFYREIDGKELFGTDTVIGDLYPDLLEQTDSGWNRAYATFGDILIRDINLPSPEHIREKLDEMLVKKGERLRDSDKSAASSPAS